MFKFGEISLDFFNKSLPDRNLKKTNPAAVGIKAPMSDERDTSAIPIMTATIRPYLSEI